MSLYAFAVLFVLGCGILLPEVSDWYRVRSVRLMYEKTGDKAVLKLMPPPRKGVTMSMPKVLDLLRRVLGPGSGPGG